MSPARGAGLQAGVDRSVAPVQEVQSKTECRMYDQTAAGESAALRGLTQSNALPLARI